MLYGRRVEEDISKVYLSLTKICTMQFRILLYAICSRGIFSGENFTFLFMFATRVASQHYRLIITIWRWFMNTCLRRSWKCTLDSALGMVCRFCFNNMLVSRYYQSIHYFDFTLNTHVAIHWSAASIRIQSISWQSMTRATFGPLYGKLVMK